MCYRGEGMAESDDIWTHLRPNTAVLLRVEQAREMDRKDDVRRTRVLDVTQEHIVCEQPDRRLTRRLEGRLMDITYLDKDSSGVPTRRVLESRLQRVGEFALVGGKTDALFFSLPHRVHTGSIRRHFRVSVPVDEGVYVVVRRPDGSPLGPVERYVLVDLSLSGVRFSCKKRVRTEAGAVVDPASLLRVADRIRTDVYLEGRQVLCAGAVVQVKIPLTGAQQDVIHFGVEFTESYEKDDETGKLRAHRFREKDARLLATYISRFQRRILRKESMV